MVESEHGRTNGMEATMTNKVFLEIIISIFNNTISFGFLSCQHDTFAGQSVSNLSIITGWYHTGSKAWCLSPVFDAM